MRRLSYQSSDVYHLIRPSYEIQALLTWCAAAAILIALWLFGPYPAAIIWPLVLCSAAFAVVRGIQGGGLLTARARLHETPANAVRPDSLRDMARTTTNVWLGWGFEWDAGARERAHVILNHGIENIQVPKCLRAWRARRNRQTVDSTRPDTGLGWVHQVGREEVLWFTPTQRAGHTLIFGVTGSGKTKLATLIASQAIARGDVVLCVDPKGDVDLEQQMREECRICNRPYVYFSLAHPEESVRWQPIAQWTRPTEIASRIAALIPGEMGGDVFQAFSWMTLATAALAQVQVLHEQPTIAGLKTVIEGDMDATLERIITHWLGLHVPDWQGKLNAMNALGQVGTGVEPGRRERAGQRPIDKLVAFYRKSGAPSEDIDNLISMAAHNKDHYGKMIATLKPLLQILTSGKLREMLSPDPARDPDDPARPIWDMRRVHEQRAVCYIGLDTLSDATVGKAVGSLMIAECASVAGYVYSHGDQNPDRRTTLLVDESGEVLNEPLIQMANKSRGAGFEIYAMAQTYSEFAAKLGSEAKGRMFAGNFNNLIVLKTRDASTQQYVMEQVGKRLVSEPTQSSSVTMMNLTDQSPLGFTGSVSQNMQTLEVETFPATLLASLPTFHYLALLGGRLVKGRAPIVQSHRGNDGT